MRMFIEDYELDIDKELTNNITYAIDDLEHLDSKATSFTKTIVLPGTANNNNLLGNIFEFNNSNFTIDGTPNVKYNFNAAKSAKCRIEVNGLQIIKGVFRLLEIVYDGHAVEYECSVFGELGGFISKVGNNRLEDLDFSAYNEQWTKTNIVNSWDNANSGTGIYYPLIDVGLVSTLKHDYKYRALKPALHVREYLDKIITNAGYTWESSFFDTDFIKRLIIPNNSKVLTRLSSIILDAYNVCPITYSIIGSVGVGMDFQIPYTNIPVLGAFTNVGDSSFQWTGAPGTYSVNFICEGTYTVTYDDAGTLIPFSDAVINMRMYLGPVGSLVELVAQVVGAPDYTGAFSLAFTGNVTINTGDYLIMDTYTEPVSVDLLHVDFTLTSSSIRVESPVPVLVPVNLGEDIVINDTIPKGIYQKDFFTSILKMFYLLVTEDKFIDKHLIIEPWINFFNTDPTTFQDWSPLVDRGKQIRMKPMSEVNARFYELKYKGDTDFYNDAYKKLYNEGYGDRFYDNGLEFSKDKDSVEVIFANSVLLGYEGEDKVVPTIFKQSNNTEERIDFVIRIMQAKKITGVSSWDMQDDDGSSIGSQTDYGYAGHLDDPDVPNADLCFGVPKQLYFALVSGDLSNNLFNAFYSSYMAEITDKDSRLLSCMVKLNETDIYNLDFSRFVYIDGGIYRLQKLIDYKPGENEPTKAELLRVIYTTY